MCVAILNKSGMLSSETFENSFENNPDGIGIAYIQNGKIKINQSMKNWKNLYNTYLDIRKKNKLPIMIHARIGTSGKTSLRNVHPFHITEKIAMCHNGIFSIKSYHKKDSDTLTLVKFLRQLKNPDALLDATSIERFIVDEIIDQSKVIFLNANGDYSIVNEKTGHWDKSGNNWYSNYTYEYCNYYNVGGKKVYKYSGNSWNANGYDNTYNAPMLDIFDLLKEARYNIQAEIIDYADLFELWEHYEIDRPKTIVDSFAQIGKLRDALQVNDNYALFQLLEDWFLADNATHDEKEKI